MGVQYEFNWMLKLSAINERQLRIGNKYPFVKKGIRTFPLDMPIDLVNEKWEAIARCIINQVTITSKVTSGEYEVIEIYDMQKRNLLTEQWRSLLMIAKEMPNVEDFSKVHIT